jgi:hypothetical protein
MANHLAREKTSLRKLQRDLLVVKCHKRTPIPKEESKLKPTILASKTKSKICKNTKLTLEDKLWRRLASIVSIGGKGKPTPTRR